MKFLVKLLTLSLALCAFLAQGMQSPAQGMQSPRSLRESTVLRQAGNEIQGGSEQQVRGSVERALESESQRDQELALLETKRAQALAFVAAEREKAEDRSGYDYEFGYGVVKQCINGAGNIEELRKAMAAAFPGKDWEAFVVKQQISTAVPMLQQQANGGAIVPQPMQAQATEAITQVIDPELQGLARLQEIDPSLDIYRLQQQSLMQPQRVTTQQQPRVEITEVPAQPTAQDVPLPFVLVPVLPANTQPATTQQEKQSWKTRFSSMWGYLYRCCENEAFLKTVRVAGVVGAGLVVYMLDNKFGKGLIKKSVKSLFSGAQVVGGYVANNAANLYSKLPSLALRKQQPTTFCGYLRKGLRLGR